MHASERWRMIDTGLRTPAQNAALDRALLEAREAGEIPSTLRFHRYTPSVLLGALHDGDPLLDVDACRARGLEIRRRLTDGGTFLCDGAHLAWTLYLAKGDVPHCDGRTVVKRLCHAAATGIAALGCDAVYRARNEIAAGGRALARCGLLYASEALMFQAVVVLEDDIATQAAILRLPWPVAERERLLRERAASLGGLLGRKPDVDALRRNLVEAYESEFGVEMREADLSLTEHARYERAIAELSAGEPLGVRPRNALHVAYASQPGPAAAVSACIVFDDDRVIRHAWISGCTLRPAGTLADLEATLRDLPADRLEARIRSFFASRPAQCEVCTPAEFAALVRRAVDQPTLAG